MNTKVAIIGSGPAGLTAAIYTSRALLDTVIIGGQEVGGQLMQTTDVENFPGFPEGVQGPELMDKMIKQAERFGAKLIKEKAIEIDIDVQPFVIKTATQTFTAESVILAMGADHKHLGLESEERLKGKGVSYCATCDGFFFKGKDIAVVGGGDSAMEEATFLTKFANKVYVVHRSEKLRASQIMQEKARNNPKIEFVLNSEVKKVLGEQKVDGLKLYNNQTQQESTLPVQGLFVAVGLVPNTEFIKGKVELDERGYIVTHKAYETSVPGLFVAGDVHDHEYRQAITAAGFGCAAALKAERYLHHKFTQKIELTEQSSVSS